MQKLNFKMKNMVSNEEILKMIYSSNEACKLIKTLKLSEDEVLQYSEKIFFYIEENKPCINCPGIKNCKKVDKGFIYKLEFDEYGGLVSKYYQCKEYKDYYGKASNIAYSTYNTDDILDADLKVFPSLVNETSKDFKEMNLALYKHAKTKGCYLTFKDQRKHKTFVLGLVATLINSYRCAVIKMSHFLQDLKANFKNNEAYENLMNKVMTAPILIIDDIGGETVSSWSRDDVLVNILNYRLDNDLITIFISEFEIEKLPLLYTLKNDKIKVDKLISRINQLTTY